MQSSVFKMLLQRAVVILGGLSLASSLTCWANDAYTDFVSIKIGNADSGVSKITSPAGSGELDVSAGQSVTLGYGFQESQLRILLELNHATRDAQIVSPVASDGSVASTTVFYNVFWVPTFKYDISAIVGGGIGYSQHKIDDLAGAGNTLVSLEDTGWSAKFALGVEYSPLPVLGVHLMYENILTDKISDKDVVGWQVADLDHSELSLGVLYRF